MPEMGKIEKDLKKMEARKAEIFELFNDTSLSSEDIETLSIETGEIDKKTTELEERWMELAEFA